MINQAEKAFDFASDLAKQLITLSTVIITVTAVFTPVVMQAIKAKSPPSSRWLICSWILYLISILSGVSALMGLTGQIARPPSGTITAEGIYADAVRTSAGCQLIAFTIATILVMIYYGLCLRNADTNLSDVAATIPNPDDPVLNTQAELRKKGEGRDIPSNQPIAVQG